MIKTTSIKFKKCSQCGGEWDEEAAFRKNCRVSSMVDTRPRCIGCELTQRNDPTPEQRARRKVDRTVQRHAQNYGMKPKEFAIRYGWNADRMAYDLLHNYENTCCYCWERYDGMGHGLDDITLDIVDREREPYYRTNVKWCCGTCNSEKATMAPELWARRLDFWPQWQRHVEAVKQGQPIGLPLFAWENPALAK